MRIENTSENANMSKRKYKEIWPKLKGSKKERKRRKRIRQSLRKRNRREIPEKRESKKKKRERNCTKTDARKRIE